MRRSKKIFGYSSSDVFIVMIVLTIFIIFIIGSADRMRVVFYVFFYHWSSTSLKTSPCPTSESDRL